MFVKLAQRLTNARNTAPQHRPASPLRAVVSGQPKAVERPERGGGTLVCRWRVLPGSAMLICGWEIEAPDGLRHPVRPARRPAVFLVANDPPGRRCPDEIAVEP
jgi:hypothetical protein